MLAIASLPRKTVDKSIAKRLKPHQPIDKTPMPKDGTMDYLRDKPTPPVIETLLSERTFRTSDERNEKKDLLLLSYYFESSFVAFRQTQHGPAILANGTVDQVGETVNRLSQNSEHIISVRRPPPFIELFQSLYRKDA
jgi:hypothetical protein